jgi:two-component system nitrate/nitrite sensor histidine kinase NarQ
MEQGILELRALLGAIQPGALDPGELGASLSSEARAVNPGAKVLVHLPADPVDGEIVVMGELHRMARELLANVREHAAGELRQLAFVVHSGRALLRVVDAGPGGCPTRSPHGHFGLSSVQEQTRLLGGTVTVRSGTAGTAITVRVPS